MRKEVSPVFAAVLAGILVVVAAVVIWKGTQKPAPDLSKWHPGPIVLPSSQQGRRMPGGAFSGGAMQTGGR